MREAAFVGHSLGSLVALEAAARAPERATRLVRLGPGVPMKVSDDLLATGRDAPLVAIDRVNVFSHSTLAAKPAFPGPGAWLHGANRALMRRTQAGQPDLNLFVHDFRLCDAYANGLQAAERVRCPVTLVIAERDQMTHPKGAQSLARALKAQVAMLPGGHSLMQEQPDAVLSAVRAALQ